MRPGKGCQNCRDRHLKCIVKNGETACTRCSESDRECNFAPRFRFRHVAHVDTARSRTSLQYDTDQIWVSTVKPLGFVLEDGSGLEDEAGDVHIDIPMDNYSPKNASKGKDELRTTDDVMVYSLPADASFQEPQIEPNDEEGWPLSAEPGSQAHRISTIDFSSPASISDLTKRHENASHGHLEWPSFGLVGGGAVTSPAGSLQTPSDTLPLPKPSRREAFLLHHFVRKLAPWYDACDLACHFALEVPKRAVQRPMILYGVLAAASRHQAIWMDQGEHEAEFYHGLSLRLVIEALSASETTYDDDLLVAVVLLRVHEEIAQSTDRYLHLHGMSRLLASIPTFAHSGGLAEAACWLSLRQDLFVSLTIGQRPTLVLEHYDQSSAFKFRDDGACANVIILILAKILRLVYSAEPQLEEEWALLEGDVVRWNDRRAKLFRPIFEEDLDLNKNRPFPVICMINAPQVVAVQYYYACKVFILLHRPTQQLAPGFYAARQRRAADRLVATHLAAIIGLAQSNEQVENANFTAHHMLRACGYTITNPLQREHAVHFLEHVHVLMGWDTSDAINLLRTQWSDLDDPKD